MSKTLVPVIVSIVVIVAVAIARHYSRALAAVTATMPLQVPLSLWIVYSTEEGNQQAMVGYSEALIIGIVGTAACTVAIWLAARAGLRLGATIAVGYAAWGLTLGAVYGVRALLRVA